VPNTFASVTRSAGQIQIYDQSPSKARLAHGIISNNTNEYGDDAGNSEYGPFASFYWHRYGQIKGSR